MHVNACDVKLGWTDGNKGMGTWKSKKGKTRSPAGSFYFSCCYNRRLS